MNYLILIGQIDLLPRLFQRVILPTAVKEELDDIGAPVERCAHGSETILPGWRSWKRPALGQQRLMKANPP